MKKGRCPGPAATQLCTKHPSLQWDCSKPMEHLGVSEQGDRAERARGAQSSRDLAELTSMTIRPFSSPKFSRD